MTLRCATCKAAVAIVDPRPKHFPFCSERCQLIDLGRWLDEEFRISEPAGTADQAPGSAPESET
jgi:endogenous inhibitor of DNA gyrase (YacG/DUF329 family)